MIINVTFNFPVYHPLRFFGVSPQVGSSVVSEITLGQAQSLHAGKPEN